MNRRARNALLAVGAAVLGCSTSATAQVAGSRQTRDYVAAAGQSDAFEMLEAETALAQSNDPQVRGFAERMLVDHARTGATLRAATDREGLMPPPTIVGADQAGLLAGLQGLRGPDFDKAYWRHQLLAHQSALTTAQTYAMKGDDPAVRQAANSAIPVITAHLAEAQKMAAAPGDT